MRKKLEIKYEEIISVENLLSAWQEFVRGKRQKKDVQEFAAHMSDNILQLHEEIANFTYVHGDYEAFNVSELSKRFAPRQFDISTTLQRLHE